jgi:hypothetical protein
MEACRFYGIDPYIERSRSGKGFHVWIFFEDRIPAWKSRSVFLRILEDTKEENGDLKTFDRFVPNQDKLSGKGLGNLIALPLQGQSIKKDCTVFLDPQKQYKAYEDQWEFLNSIKKSSQSLIDEFIHNLELNPEKKKEPSLEKLGSQEELERVLENCDFIKYCSENASTLREPLWYCMISNLARFEGGEEKIHQISKPYPEYTWNETEAKIRHALRDTGPHCCETIRKEGFDCKRDCEVMSPAGLGYRINNRGKGG